MTTQPMPLEETAKHLASWKEKMEGFFVFLNMPVTTTAAPKNDTERDLRWQYATLTSALHHLEAGKEERERCEEALGWALSLIANEDPYWSNSTGYAMAERVLSVLQERMGKVPQLPSKDANESALQNLLESYEAIAVQNRCGCEHPACKNCQRDKHLDAAKAAMSTTPTKEPQG